MAALQRDETGRNGAGAFSPGHSHHAARGREAWVKEQSRAEGAHGVRNVLTGVLGKVHSHGAAAGHGCLLLWRLDVAVRVREGAWAGSTGPSTWVVWVGIRL
jgi:hypothetical protein